MVVLLNMVNYKAIQPFNYLIINEILRGHLLPSLIILISTRRFVLCSNSVCGDS